MTLTDEVSVGLGAEITVAIDPSLVQSSTWTYGYEAPEYYLTSADGPWGSLVFDYDEIGNRVSEDRDGLLETYTYELNPGGGNSPILESVLPQGGGSRDFTYGLAGHLELFEAGLNEIDFTVDDDGRLGEITRLPGQEDEDSVEFLYDGRSFLSSVINGTGSATPTYSSEGLLLGLERQDSGVAPVEEFSILYFAGRPVAQLKEVDATSALTYLTTDHLGTPLLATDEAGVDVWAGPFDPFGGDTFGQALESDVFLRLPGQWADSLW